MVIVTKLLTGMLLKAILYHCFGKNILYVNMHTLGKNNMELNIGLGGKKLL